MESFLLDYINLIGGKKKGKVSREYSTYDNKQFTKMSESYDYYISKVVPQISNRKTEWIYNLIDNKGSEGSEGIIYQDEYFILIQDKKWKSNNIYDLHIVAFFKDRTLRCIRDLNGNHIDLLEHVKNKSCEVLKKNYNLTENQLNILFHYRPSVWLLHIHFINSMFKTYDVAVDKAHYVFNVIENLKLDSEYFKKIKLQVYKNKFID